MLLSLLRAVSQPELVQTQREANGRKRPGGGRKLSTACLLSSVFCLLLLGPAAAQFKLPPPGDRSVHDFGNVLNTEAVKTLERWHRELFEKTGVAIVVVTIPRLEGEAIEQFGVRVGTEWGVGKRGEDRGIVVSLAVEERGINISTGYGVEGFLPDGRVGAILDAAVPALSRSDFSTGVVQISAALLEATAREHGVTIEGTEQAARPEGGPAEGQQLLASLIAVVLILAIFYLFVRHPVLALLLMQSGTRHGMRTRGFGGGGFGGGSGFGGFRGGGFGGGGASRRF